MNFENTQNRFRLLSGLSETECEQWNSVMSESSDYVNSIVVKKELTESGEGLVLKLYARNDGEDLATALQNLYFWELYPKLAQKTISVSVSMYYPNFPGH